MTIIENVLLAASLCADTLSVTVAGSVALGKVKVSKAAYIGLVLGIVQGAIIFIGWAAGYAVAGYIARIADWVGFILLLYIGGKMIYEGLKKGSDEGDVNLTNLWALIVIGVAASIDASAVGIAMSMDKIGLTDMLITTFIVFLVTMLIGMTGTLCGSYIGQKFGKIASILGGVVLICIGLRILLW